MSHPIWVRGLKQKLPHVKYEQILVAPHMGAWIETGNNRDSDPDSRSHPIWVRGLKLLSSLTKSVCTKVAPHVGAWIETAFGELERYICYVAPHVGAWIETNCRTINCRRQSVAPLYGHVVFKH